MQSRSLPERPNLDHLKNEAKALHKTLRAAESGRQAHRRAATVAREYGFPTWAKLRAHVQNDRATTMASPRSCARSRSRIATPPQRSSQEPAVDLHAASTSPRRSARPKR